MDDELSDNGGVPEVGEAEAGDEGSALPPLYPFKLHD